MWITTITTQYLSCTGFTFSVTLGHPSNACDSGAGELSSLLDTLRICNKPLHLPKFLLIIQNQGPGPAAFTSEGDNCLVNGQALSAIDHLAHPGYGVLHFGGSEVLSDVHRSSMTHMILSLHKLCPTARLSITKAHYDDIKYYYLLEDGTRLNPSTRR